MEQLVVVRPFGKWRVGDLVNDEATCKEIRDSEQADNVVRVIIPEVQ